jgi:hypothetical protein
MAQKKRTAGAKKAKAATSKKVAPKKVASVAAAPKVTLTGEPLVLHILKGAKVDLKVAAATGPGEALDTYFLDAGRAIDAYRAARREFAEVPTFRAAVADAASSLMSHAKSVNREWQKVRFANKKGANRKGLRKAAEKLRSTVLEACRFLFRNDQASLDEVDRIAEGEGLADLIQDMEDLAVLAKAHAELFARVDKIAGTAETAEELRVALQEMKDGKAARDLLASRNRAVASLSLALAEIRAGARFLHGGEPAALAPYASSSLPRVRATRTKKKEAEQTGTKSKPKKPVEPDDMDGDADE